jgi:hypothetical protein
LRRRLGWYDSKKADNDGQTLQIVAVDREKAEEDDGDLVLAVLFSRYE